GRKTPVVRFAAGLSRCCTEVRTKTVTTVAASRHQCLAAAGPNDRPGGGRASAWSSSCPFFSSISWRASYLPSQWLLRERSVLLSVRCSLRDAEAERAIDCGLAKRLRRFNLDVELTSMHHQSAFNQLGQCFVKVK